MKESINFTPKHPQPVTLDALLQLEPATISAEISRLENSINHLVQSNADLLSAEMAESDAEEKTVWKNAREENEDVINRQRERITMMKMAIFQMIGVREDNPHYNKESDSVAGRNGSVIAPIDGTANQEAASPSGESTPGEHGVFL